MVKIGDLKEFSLVFHTHDGSILLSTAEYQAWVSRVCVRKCDQDELIVSTRQNNIVSGYFEQIRST